MLNWNCSAAWMFPLTAELCMSSIAADLVQSSQRLRGRRHWNGDGHWGPTEWVVPLRREKKQKWGGCGRNDEEIGFFRASSPTPDLSLSFPQSQLPFGDSVSPMCGIASPTLSSNWRCVLLLSYSTWGGGWGVHLRNFNRSKRFSLWCCKLETSPMTTFWTQLALKRRVIWRMGERAC